MEPRWRAPGRLLTALACSTLLIGFAQCADPAAAPAVDNAPTEALTLTLQPTAVTPAAAAAAAVAAPGAPAPPLRPPGQRSNSSGGFITRMGAQLMNGAAPFYFAGGNFYPAATWAVEGTARTNISYTFAQMQQLGLTVLRTWAYNDGPGWHAIQTAPGVLNETSLSQGLDWVVAEARKHKLRLILTLTNYNDDYGGAAQYVRWANGTQQCQFFTDPLIREQYKNYTRRIVTRNNTLTGVTYRDDPTVMAWELINEPLCPGDDSGNNVTAWHDEMSTWIKKLDANHLVMSGVHGFYGQAQPSRVADNPPTNNLYGGTLNGGGPYPQNAVCLGADFLRNNQPAVRAFPLFAGNQNIDITSIHVWPDHWLLCSEECKLNFTRQWIRGHADTAARLNKPLVIGEFGATPPLSYRNNFMRAVYDEAKQSQQAQGPIAGTAVWMLAPDPKIAAYWGYDAFNIFFDQAEYLKPSPLPYYAPTKDPVKDAKALEFNGWAALMACFNYYRNYPNALVPTIRRDQAVADGWDTSLSIIRQGASSAAQSY